MMLSVLQLCHVNNFLLFDQTVSSSIIPYIYTGYAVSKFHHEPHAIKTNAPDHVVIVLHHTLIDSYDCYYHSDYYLSSYALISL
jgi:tRNA G26 N,N-dimethylase Trm1